MFLPASTNDGLSRRGDAIDYSRQFSATKQDEDTLKRSLQLRSGRLRLIRTGPQSTSGGA